MTVSTVPPESKTVPAADRPDADRMDLPGQHRPATPRPRTAKRRGLLWLVFLLTIAGVAGYAVWRAGQPIAPQRAQGGGGGRGGGGRGGGGLGPVPVVVQEVGRSSIPVVLNGLGNVTAFYTVTVRSRVDGQLLNVGFKEGDLVKEGQVLMEIDPRPYQVQLELAQGTRARDQALLPFAGADLERYTALLAQDAVPKQQLDTQKALVAQYEGNLTTDQANIDNAKLNLTYAKVTA